MSQTKTQSLKEAVSNTAVGFIISYMSTFLIFPLVGFSSNPSKNLVITIYFTVISILRGYVIRRWFNKKATIKERVTYPSGEDFLVHCFDCEMEMPVIKKEQNYYCSNCGLKH